MRTSIPTGRRLFRRHVALPQQHGSWAIWLGPYAVGVGVGGNLGVGLLFLTLAATGAFLALQPLTLIVKVLSGRRSQPDLPVALFWLSCWSALAGLGCFGLAVIGHGRVLWLGLAALPVVIWEMWLVARRTERGQLGVELVAAGVLTLAAPAAYQVTSGAGPVGWWLWILCWFQAAGAVVYVYLRLEHRRLDRLPDWSDRLGMARRVLLYNGTNLICVAIFSFLHLIPWLVLIPFAAVLGEVIDGGLLRPCTGEKPSSIGARQVLVTIAFSGLLILAYRIT